MSPKHHRLNNIYKSNSKTLYFGLWSREVLIVLFKENERNEKTYQNVLHSWRCFYTIGNKPINLLKQDGIQIWINEMPMYGILIRFFYSFFTQSFIQIQNRYTRLIQICERSIWLTLHFSLFIPFEFFEIFVWYYTYSSVRPFQNLTWEWSFEVWE